MNNTMQQFRVNVFSALISSLALASPTVFSATPTPPGLFTELSTGAKTVLPKNTIKGHHRLVQIDQKKLRKGRFFVKLPDGMSYEAVRELQQERGNGRYTWVGHASDNPDNRVVIGVSGDAVAGTFSYRGKMFKLEPRANGSHVLAEVSPKDPAPELDPIAVADTKSAAVAADTTNTAVAADGSVIDVLVAYTPAVKALYGAAGTDALILQAVAEANQAYANSGMSTRMNLVKSVLTNYVEADMSTDLSRLRSTSDGYMDELHTVRNQYGADVVSLIENEPSYCGLAYRMTSLSSSFASSAFSVVHASCATGYYSFAHEIGHNQGAHHDHANATGSAAIYPYGYGYQEPNNLFRDIMAYNCPAGCERIGYFANASVLYNGVPTGMVSYAEDALAIDKSAATVASFRQPVNAALPVAPTSLVATALGPNQVNLNWADRSTNESGFILERSTNNLNFTQVASLAANTTQFKDENLAPSTLYQYRARAWNSSGNSAYSNVAAVATNAPSPYVYQYVFAESTVAGVLKGTYKNLASKDGVKESITETTSGTTQPVSKLEHYWKIQVQPGKSVTLVADATTKSPSQTFTFAYSTVQGLLDWNRSDWIDMFTVSSKSSSAMQFTLPSTLSGTVYVSVRDNQRVIGKTSTDTLSVDSLVIRTEVSN